MDVSIGAGTSKDVYGSVFVCICVHIGRYALNCIVLCETTFLNQTLCRRSIITKKITGIGFCVGPASG